MERAKLAAELLAALVIASGAAQAATTPQVVATNPPNGAVGVRPDFGTIQFLFDRPLAVPSADPRVRCIAHSDNWPTTAVPVPGSGGLQYHFSRMTGSNPLPFGSQVRLILNPDGARCFVDLEGVPLPTYELVFTVRERPTDPPIEPQVVSATPPAGATGVSPYVSSVSFSFSKPMAEFDPRLRSPILSSGWGPSTIEWSADRRTLTLTRTNRDALHPGAKILFILNHGLSMQLRDSGDNVLREHVHHFVILGDFRESFEIVSRSTIAKIPEDPARGFHWPYYLAVPAVPRSPAVLFVEPNNTGFATLESHIPHDARAEETVCFRTARVNGEWKLDVPVLVPAFPRSYGIYTQSGSLWLPRDCNCPELERPDIQLAAMIEDAKDRLRSAGWTVHDRVFMNGFSASGGFTETFALLHPERIKAAACGGGVPSIPDGNRLAEIAAVTGRKPKLRAYYALPMLFYCGDRDANYSPAAWDAAAQFFEMAHANFTLVLYPGVGHNLTSEIWKDLGRFFEGHLPRFNVWSSLAGQVVDGCSVSSRPVFGWDSDERFRSVEAHFASTADFSKAVKVKFRARKTEVALKPAVWKRVLRLPGAAGGAVFWRSVGTLAGKKRASSRTESFVVAGAKGVGNPRISHASRSELAPPTLSWESSCNVRFKVWFGDGPDLGRPGTKKKSLSFSQPGGREDGAFFSKALTTRQWASIWKLVGGEPGRTLYWQVESWDALKRPARTEVQSFILIP